MGIQSYIILIISYTPTRISPAYTRRGWHELPLRITVFDRGRVLWLRWLRRHGYMAIAAIQDTTHTRKLNLTGYGRLGLLYLCLIRNVEFEFDTPYVDSELTAPSCPSHSKCQVLGFVLHTSVLGSLHPRVIRHAGFGFLLPMLFDMGALSCRHVCVVQYLRFGLS